MADDGSLRPVVVLALHPALAYAGTEPPVRVTGQGGAHGHAGVKHTEHHVVLYHIKVPGDHRAPVGVLNDYLEHLESSQFTILNPHHISLTCPLFSKMDW